MKIVSSGSIEHNKSESKNNNKKKDHVTRTAFR